MKTILIRRKSIFHGIFLKSRILLLTFIVNSFCFSQEQNETANNGTHEFFAYAQIKSCNALGENVATTPETAYSGIRFNIVYVTSSGYVIYIYQKNEADKNDSTNAVTTSAIEFNKKYNSIDGTLFSTQRKFFFITFDEYKRCAYRLRKKCGFIVGAATSIIKIRPGIKKTYDQPYPIYFDFGNDFSLGVLFGLKLNPSRPTAKSSFNLLAGFGTVSLPVDSLRTKGFTNTYSNNQGLYGSFGAVFDYQNFQLGLFLGVDFMTGKTGQYWIYRDRPWVGISVGYSIFKRQGASEESSN